MSHIACDIACLTLMHLLILLGAKQNIEQERKERTNTAKKRKFAEKAREAGEKKKAKRSRHKCMPVKVSILPFKYCHLAFVK